MNSSSLNEPNNCSNIILVAVNRIPQEGYDEWLKENQEYLYDATTKTENTSTDALAAIDASKIRKADFAAWLKANGDYIFFEGTYPYIECVHNANTANISDSTSYSPLTLLEIKAQITARGGNFHTDNYNKYTSLYIDSITNAVTVDVVNDFDSTSNCFSMPLFRSIVQLYTLNDTSVFEFKTATVNGYRTIVFRVQNTAGMFNYYDFSQIPP